MSKKASSSLKVRISKQWICKDIFVISAKGSTKE